MLLLIASVAMEPNRSKKVWLAETRDFDSIDLVTGLPRMPLVYKVKSIQISRGLVALIDYVTKPQINNSTAFRSVIIT